MLKKGLLLTVCFLFVFVLVFGTNGIASAEGRIAIVFATGGLGDKSFNDSAYEGMQRAQEELGIEFDQAEPSAITEYETYLTQFASSQRYDLIISIGFDQADALTKVAERFSNQKFAIVDAVVDKPNVASYVYEEKERGFLMGVAAAMMTTRTEDSKINDDKVIGVIGGMKIPLIDANIAGYIAGAEYIDPEVKVMHTYVGGWADPAKGKELTLSMIEKGVDVAWGAAGRSGLGVIKAAQQEDCYAIGADSDQSNEAPEHVLTNGMKFVNSIVYLAIQQALNDEFTAGIHALGVEEKALGYTESLLPETVIEELEKVKDKIAAGEITIPGTIEEAQSQ